MKIAIISDCHDQWENLERAVEIANDEECKILLFAGDLIAPPGLAILEKFNGQVKFVWGNNEGEKMGMTRKMDASEKIELCGNVFEGEINGVRIFMNHYPRLAELAAKSGEFDLCVCGHTHLYKEERIGECILLNPGELHGHKTSKPTFAIFDTREKKTTQAQI